MPNRKSCTSVPLLTDCVARLVLYPAERRSRLLISWLLILQIHIYYVLINVLHLTLLPYVGTNVPTSKQCYDMRLVQIDPSRIIEINSAVYQSEHYFDITKHVQSIHESPSNQLTFHLTTYKVQLSGHQVITLCCEILSEQDPERPHKAAASRSGNSHPRHKIRYILLHRYLRSFRWLFFAAGGGFYLFTWRGVAVKLYLRTFHDLKLYADARMNVYCPMGYYI